jgi:hypothetical protein
MLLPTPHADQPPTDATRVTYILDRDLVRFAKFTVAVLAVFLVVGAYLFGFKLEAALDKVRSTQEDLKVTHEKMALAQRELEAAQAMVRSLKKDVEAVLADAKGSLKRISDTEAAAVEVVVSMKKLSPLEVAALQKAKVEQPDRFRQGGRKFWPNGATIRIRFLDGDAKAQAEVVRIARKWTDHANLRFEFVSGGDAEVRVSFKQAGSWSFLGTDALAVPTGQATINFAWVDQRTVLHEFGHVLGLIEEHLNPRAKIAWNKDEIYRELGGPPNNWDKATIDVNVFGQASASQLGDYREFDPDSVMTMTMPKSWTGGRVFGGRDDLSDSDKLLVARLYPRPS